MTTAQAFIVALALLTLTAGSFWGLSMLGFGWLTVRRLRRNPQTRQCLGFPLYPGWQLMSAAAALSVPRRVARRRDRGRFALFRAQSDTLYAHTSTRDRLLARCCYWSHLLFCLLILLSGCTVAWH